MPNSIQLARRWHIKCSPVKRPSSIEFKDRPRRLLMESGDSTPQVHPSSPSSGENLVIESESPSSSANDSENTSSGSGPTSMSSGAYPIRKRRNPAVLIRWIEDHPCNPYPTKGEKQGLAFYAGMTQRQLNDWFANARRNIKKNGYDNWKKKHNGFSAILSGMPLASKTL